MRCLVGCRPWFGFAFAIQSAMLVIAWRMLSPGCPPSPTVSLVRSVLLERQRLPRGEVGTHHPPWIDPCDDPSERLAHPRTAGGENRLDVISTEGMGKDGDLIDEAVHWWMRECLAQAQTKGPNPIDVDQRRVTRCRGHLSINIDLERALHADKREMMELILFDA
jgi:hypothetical protein